MLALPGPKSAGSERDARPHAPPAGRRVVQAKVNPAKVNPAWTRLATSRPAGGADRFVGRSGDPAEGAADRMADAALSVAGTRSPGEAAVSRSPVGPTPSTGSLESAPDSVGAALAGSGRPLPDGVRADMEGRFGHDFSRVRVHDDAHADRSAGDLAADAYTVGDDIAFAGGRYAPATTQGRRLLAHELAHVVQQDPVVRPYRSKKAFNFGKLDEPGLVEDSFDPSKDRKTKPWIESVTVVFNAKSTDPDGADAWTGTATAHYFDNPAKLPDFTFPVTGGSAQLGRTDKGNFVVHRIEGVGYNSGSFSGTPGVDYDPANREGPGKKYSKDLAANMSYAVFYNRGEALHAGPLDFSSHGCVHVDWNSLSTVKQLNYHSVIGLTKVRVSYASP